jgi:hypothetical protein
MGPDGVALKNHGHVPALRRDQEGRRRNHLAIDPYLTRIRLKESRNQPECSRFPAAGRTEKRNQFAVVDVEVEGIDGFDPGTKYFCQP